MGSISFRKLKKFLLQVDLLATVKACFYQELVTLKELEEKIFSLNFTSYFQEYFYETIYAGSLL